MSLGVSTRRPELDDGPEPMDPRLRARRVEVARDQGRRRRRAIVALAMATALVLVGLVVARSRLLDVDAVTVTGAGRSGPDVVRVAAAIAPGRPMTSVDLDAVEARVEGLPWVAQATVTRRWPGTVAIRVGERTPVAVVGERSDGVVVDRGGTILGPALLTDRLPLAGPATVLRPGQRLPAGQRRIVGMLADLPTDLLGDVARGTVSGDGLGLVLRDGIEVDLGDSTRIGAKAAAINVLLAKADRDTIATLDVTVAGAPAVTRRPPLVDPDPASTPGLPAITPGLPAITPGLPALTTDEPGGT